MANFAVIDKDQKVVNIVVWDEVSEWAPQKGTVLVKYEKAKVNAERTNVPEIGGAYEPATGKFIAPQEIKKAE